MPLDCGVNWYTGTFEDLEPIPGGPAGSMVAMQVAQTIAIGKAINKIDQIYGTPCPARTCPNKSGLYSLQISLQFAKLKKGVAVKCTVGWLLAVTCEPDGDNFAQPFEEDWKKLHKLYEEANTKKKAKRKRG